MTGLAAEFIENTASDFPGDVLVCPVQQGPMLKEATYVGHVASTRVPRDRGYLRRLAFTDAVVHPQKQMEALMGETGRDGNGSFANIVTFVPELRL